MVALPPSLLLLCRELGTMTKHHTYSAIVRATSQLKTSNLLDSCVGVVMTHLGKWTAAG